ncbi:MAG TPA: nuclear transport factor 2 family protein, partial [Terriglobia bacterium]|nr:nuclear transport factor 2 family protein [Terriglobia bacterium]
RVACLLALSVLTSCGGRTAATGVDAESLESLRTEALALSDQLVGIYKSGDWRALLSLLDPGYLGTAPGIQWNLAALQREFPKIRLSEYHREAFIVKKLAPGMVLLNEDGTLRETYDGQDISGRYRFTTIWVKRAGSWRLLFEQEVPLAEEGLGAGIPGKGSPSGMRH